MSLFEALILGLVQGLTEFLPISSSAHIRIVGDVFGWGDPGAAFTAVIQIGTELAVTLFFIRDIARIISHWFRSLPGVTSHRLTMEDPDVRMGWIVIVGTVPIVVLGLLFQDAIETNLRSLYVVASVLIIFGLFLGWADRHATQTRTLSTMGVRDGVILGFAQSLALIPGVSRSGGTITFGLLLGYTREASARISFLLAIPAVWGAGLFQLFKASGLGALPVVPTILATVISFAVGYAVIVWFLKLISTHSYRGFVIYRVILGVLVFAGLASHVLSA
ncbi:MAG: undecaprenyl-diphosphate phosphatase [Actinomycetaceae bacterium]|nr:undecaprenyl-diphosphate phosphatase [Actinomycetaceae bacterium]MDY6083217.1 undecaprenyl-diphosphate phosphatase [Actinomycetaceae bacterium]